MALGDHVLAEDAFESEAVARGGMALCKAGFAHSVRGRQGGYVRGRSLDAISVADVWRAVGLKKDDDGCLERVCAFGVGVRCVVGRELMRLQHDLLAVFAQRTVESLSRPTCSVTRSRNQAKSSDADESNARRFLSDSRSHFGEVVEASACSGI